MEYLVRKEEISDFASTFWSIADGKKVFAFYGEMGAGKTTLISAICRAKGVADHPSSPTFAIINEYALPGGDPLYHSDLYRLKDEQEAVNAGVADCIDSGYHCFVEWPERAPELFDENSLKVKIESVSPEERKITVN